MSARAGPPPTAIHSVQAAGAAVQGALLSDARAVTANTASSAATIKVEKRMTDGCIAPRRGREKYPRPLPTGA